MTPRRILLAGWLLLVLYAYPGYMSYDSVVQLLQARDGVFAGGHPPVMGVLWRMTDALLAGPIGMLMIQITCFMAGAYLLLRRFMAPRTAAFATVAITWFPPVAAVLAVIWKDSQMAAYLMLGTSLLLSTSRRVRLAGLGLMFLATAMRYNAAAITLPLIGLLFEWQTGMRRLRRYGIALAAWIAITLGTATINSQLASSGGALWTDALALYDITGTLRYAPDQADEKLRDQLAGTPLLVTSDIQAFTRTTPSNDDLPERIVRSFGSGTYVPALWVTTRHVFAIPETDAERSAIVRAWRSIVLSHPSAYLRYRWEVLHERLYLSGDVPGSAYVWFGDVSDFETSIASTEHHAVPSKLQKRMQPAMLWLGTSSLFRPWIYLVLLVVAAAYAVRTRMLLAVVASGLANELALFVLAPTIDFRYSIWLVVVTLVTSMVAADKLWKRLHHRRSEV